MGQLEINQAHVVGYSMGAAIVNKLRDLYQERLFSVTLSGYGLPPFPDVYSSELEEEIRKKPRSDESFGRQQSKGSWALGLLGS